MKTYNCPECGNRRVNTPSGSMCPEGHGKIEFKIPRKVLSELERDEWIQTLPLARPTGAGTFQVGELVYRQGSKGRVKTWETYVDGSIAAVSSLSSKPQVIKLVPEL